MRSLFVSVSGPLPRLSLDELPSEELEGDDDDHLGDDGHDGSERY